MELRLFDLHCDTPTRLYGTCSSLEKNDLHVSLEKTSAFSRYVQIMAIWTPNAMPDSTGFSNFHKVADYLMNELEGHLYAYIADDYSVTLVISDDGPLYNALYDANFDFEQAVNVAYNDHSVIDVAARRAK
jgi:hypothetical protein